MARPMDKAAPTRMAMAMAMVMVTTTDTSTNTVTATVTNTSTTRGPAKNTTSVPACRDIATDARLETAVVSHDSVVQSLLGAGLNKSALASLNLLEVGSGAGAVTSHYANSFRSVHSIDTSPSMLQTLSKYVTSHNVTHALHAISPASAQQFKSGQAMRSPTSSEPERTLAPPRDAFDVAVANLVLHHIDDTRSFLAGVVGLLKPGGWFVITEFGLREDGELTDLERQMRDGKKNEHGSVNEANHFHAAWTVDSIQALLRDNGLVQTHAEMGDTKLPVFPDEGKWPLNLIARGRKPA